jgi:GR25 family glycosyltransferase involved in LPS biosynthesis
MSNRAKLFILSMRNSARLIILKKRLRELRIKNYKIFYGTNLNIKNREKLIYKYYNKNIAENYIGRPMTANEIDCERTVIKVYKYIVKKKVKNVIIMTDDIYPSHLFKKWIDSKIFLTGLKVVGFFSAPPGFLQKKPIKIFNDLKVSLHLASTHIFNSWCMQINYNYCKYYLRVTRGKVIGLSDFAFNFKDAGIGVFQTIPYLVYPDDKGVSYIRDERNNNEKSLISWSVKEKIKKNFFFNKILNFFRIIWYITFFGYFFKKCNIKYYKEYYFDKYKLYLVNFFFRNHININEIFNKYNNYPREFKKFVKSIKV